MVRDVICDIPILVVAYVLFWGPYIVQAWIPAKSAENRCWVVLHSVINDRGRSVLVLNLGN